MADRFVLICILRCFCRALNAVVVRGDMKEFRESVQMVVALGLSSSFFTFIRGTGVWVGSLT